jgi:arginase
MRVSRQRDDAHARMVAPQARHRGDAVDERHVQVDHDRVGLELLRELDRAEAVGGRAHDVELGLALDQQAQRLEERAVVVGEEDMNRPASPFLGSHPGEVSLVAPTVQPPVHKVAVIGAPLDLGAGRRGVDMGPSAIRYAGLDTRLREIGHEAVDLGNVETAVAEASEIEDERVRFLPQIKEAWTRIAALVQRAARDGSLPLVLGGDHTVALGTLIGMSRVHGRGGVLWIDAHADLNSPETTPSGNVHGMVLAAALGLAGPVFDDPALPAVDPKRVALVGVRSIDEGEREALRSLDAKVFTMSEVDRLGVERAVRESLTHVAGPGFVHVSVDMDVVDPDVAPGVGTPIRGGFNYREAHLALELVAESGLMSSLDIVEVNPILDRENQTGKLAVELAASALGARIL